MKNSFFSGLLLIFIACGTFAQDSTIEIPSRDLENLAIVDNGRTATLEKTLNQCTTQAGKKCFTRSLQHLTADKDTLIKRQEILKKLAACPPQLEALRELLISCGTTEKSLEMLSSKLSPALDEFYFKRSQFQSLNNKPAALTSTFFLHYFHLFAPLLEHALLHVGIDSVFSKFAGSHNHHDHGHHHHHGCGCSHAHGFSKADLMYYAIQAAHWGLHLPGYYEIVTHMQSRRAKIIAAQQEIADLKKYLEAVHNLYDQVSHLNPEFIVQYAPKLQKVFGVAPEKNEAQEMITTIITTSWDSSIQNSFMPGTILATQALIKKNAALLHEIAQEVGVIDAYVHVACLCMQQTDKNPYCFVTFIENNEPYVRFEQLWHHAIAADAMRPLTISIENNNRCLLIQGANGSGKSTMLTALGHALFLAQSWGIAPATCATLTPFSCIHTHSLKRDAIEQGLSHFYYEHAYYESMFKRGGQGLTIALLDEPYTCTDPKTGADYLTDLMDRIKEVPSKTAVITTHYAL